MLQLVLFCALSTRAAGWAPQQQRRNHFKSRSPLPEACAIPPPSTTTVETRGNKYQKTSKLPLNPSLRNRNLNSGVAPFVDSGTAQARLDPAPKRKVSKLQSIRDNKHDWKKAVRILNEMGSGGRTTAAFDATIRACAVGGQSRRALELLDEMEKEGIVATGSTYRSVVNACVKNGDWQKALEIFSLIEDRELKLTTAAVNLAISACRQGKQWEKALLLLNSMPDRGLQPDVITFSAVISSCRSSGNWRKAVELLQLMETRGVKPNTIAMNAVISACEKGGQWMKALDLLESMPGRGLRPDVITMNAAISACEKGEQWEMALDLLESMPGRGLRPDVITMNAAISACEKGGEWQKAVILLESMPRRGLKPNVITFSAAISACEKGEQWQKALDLLAHMERINVKPNAVTLNAAITACHRGRQWQHAETLYEKMPQYRCVPDAYTYSAMVYGWVMSGHPEKALNALGLLAATRRDLLTTRLLNAALNACNKSPEPRCEAAHDLFVLAGEFDIELDQASLSMLMSCHAKSGDGAGVLTYLDEASRRSLSLSTASLNFVLCQLGHRGLATEALHVLKHMEAHGGLMVEALSYHAVMTACFRAGDYESQFNVLAAMRASALQPDEVAFSLALKACELSDFSSPETWVRPTEIIQDAEQCGVASSGLYARTLALLARHARPKEASKVFRDLISHGREVVPEHCASVVTAYYKAGDSRGAAETVEWLDAGDHPLGVAAYTSAIAACRSEGDWKRARGLYHALRRRACAPNAPLFNALLSVYSNADPHEAAVAEVLADMSELNVVYDTGTYTSLMSLHSRAQAWPVVIELWSDVLANPSIQRTAAVAWLVVNSAKHLRDGTTAENVFDVVEKDNIAVGPDFYCAAIKACADDGLRALKLLDRVNKMGGAQDTLTADCFATTIFACDREGLWRDALQTLVLMIKAGFQPSVDVYNAGVRACVQSNEWGMAYRIYGFMRRSGVQLQDIDHSEAIADYASSEGLSIEKVAP